MANDIMNLLDLLYQMVDEAKGVLMAPGKCIIDQERALDLIDDIKGLLPKELESAQKLLRDRDNFVASVTKEAEQIRRQAEQDAKTIVGESEIARVARDKANDMIRRADERSKKMIAVTNEYTDDALRRTEEAIQMALDEIRDSRSRFRAVSNEQLQSQRAKLDQDNK